VTVANAVGSGNAKPTEKLNDVEEGWATIGAGGG